MAGVKVLPLYVAAPPGEWRWPVVVATHDALGMSRDFKNQADWLAGEGYLAAAASLLHWGGRMACCRAVVRDAICGGEER
jgi:carboxymethylenebutenolidase